MSTLKTISFRLPTEAVETLDGRMYRASFPKLKVETI